MHIDVLLYSINLYDTSTSLREQIYYKPIFIVIAVFTMDGQYHFSRIKLNPHFYEEKFAHTNPRRSNLIRDYLFTCLGE